MQAFAAFSLLQNGMLPNRVVHPSLGEEQV
jgi:hypothetical protein